MKTAESASPAQQAADVLVCALPALANNNSNGNGSAKRKNAGAECAGIAKPEFAELISHELTRLLETHPDLVEAARRAGSEPQRNGAWSHLRKRMAQALEGDEEKMEVIWSLLLAAGAVNSGPPASPAPRSSVPGWVSTLLARVETVVALLVLSAIVLVPMALAGSETSQNLLRWFAVIVMASLPGWLFLRFIVFRAGSLWNDYVLHLHRLGMDAHQNLPRPPANSSYHRLWVDGGGLALEASDNIYQQKFEAYYGKAAGPAGASGRTFLRDRSVYTVIIATAIFAVGWAAVLSGDGLFRGDVEIPNDALRFAFLGAYSFNLQMLMRRFFQSDLKSSAYIAASVRVITVLILVTVLARSGLLGLGISDQVQCATAFVIGFFPLVGMQVLQRAVSASLRRWVPTLRNPYPLSDLDGLNIWYEARLLEEGIEDMQNLVTANLVDVLLHTRVPVGRLVDWVDQAHLYLLLDPVDGDDSKERSHPHRLELRRHGIRTATDLESAVRPPDVLARRSNSTSVKRLEEDDDEFVAAIRGVLNQVPPADANEVVKGPNIVDGILKTLCNSPNLVHVRHWRDVLESEHEHAAAAA